MTSTTPTPPTPGPGRELVVVANRLPVTRQRRKGAALWGTSPGGLVSALLPMLQETRGTWIGWSGAADDAPEPFVHDGVRNVPVLVSRPEVRDYYDGFANATLWPLYHDCVQPPVFCRDWWGPYSAVNRRFAEAVDRWAAPGACVWVHDYHLQLVPALLRERRPDLRIGFFLHIPFPPQELFQQLPWRRRILEGLLGADVVGFQTRIAADNFARLVRRYLASPARGGRIEHAGRSISYRAFPISIDFERFARAARDPRIQSRKERIRSRVGNGSKILLGIDRVDYTKGIVERLQALREVLRSGAVRPQDCVLIQTGVPSRERVAEYRNTRQRIEGLVGEINGEYGSLEHPLVHYIHKSFPFEELVALYGAADVMLVTPLRDGMNLVAKEFVAARPDERGALVLSEFAGAALELRDALIVNPHDVEGVAAAIAAALVLSESEQRRRMRSLRRAVRKHDVHEWARSFLQALDAGEEGERGRSETGGSHGARASSPAAGRSFPDRLESFAGPSGGRPLGTR